ncbi:MAG: glycosyltransferase [Bacteroidetes bacterium]|nr:glycosyltransferase [Bacteroidota bacterium]
MLATDWYLPGTKAGGPVRSVYSIVNLLKNNFDFYIVTTNCDLGSNKPYPNIKPNELFNADGINYYYFSKEALTKSSLQLLINNVSPQLIHLNSFWSYYFSITFVNLKNSQKINCPILLSPRGMLHGGALRIKPVKKKIYLLLSKIQNKYSKIIFHATNHIEQAKILHYFPNNKIFIAPNVSLLQNTTNKSVKQKNHLNLFYLSRVSKIKNLHFALEILSKLPPEITVEYTIYGNIEDAAYWNKCNTVIKNLQKNIIVTQANELNFSKINEALTTHNYLFLPTKNENFGHSIVEALNCGCPAIISDQTPWTDINNSNCGAAIDLNNSNFFIKKLIEYAAYNQSEFNTQSENAVNYILKKINLEQVKQTYIDLYINASQN